MMKVLCVTDRADRPETELFVRLSKQVDRLVVMCNPEGRNAHILAEQNIPTLTLKVRHRHDREATTAIREELERDDYDIAHAFNTRALACLLRAGRRTRTRLLGYRGVTTGVSYLKPESWHTFLHPRLDGIYCVAEAVRQALLDTRFLGWHLPESKLKTIHKGHDPAWYATAPADLTSLGLPPKATPICCISRNSVKKGIMTLIDAFDQLPAAANLHLVLVGSISDSVALKKRIANSPLAERIHFTGYRNDVPAILRSCRLLVSASQSGEGLPRVIIEAMSVGCPVVATDAGGTSELVIDGQSGLLLPPGDTAAMHDAILDVMSDEHAAQARARNALELIRESFNAELTAQRTLEWYEELLKR